MGFQAAFLAYRIEPRVMTHDYVRKRFATGEHPFENHAASCVAYEKEFQPPADEVYNTSCGGLLLTRYRGSAQTWALAWR